MDCTRADMCGISIMGLITGSVQQGKRSLRDVHRQIAHALQIGIDLERGDDQAQIRRHGLLRAPAD